jgi:hypothetical protein
MPSSL